MNPIDTTLGFATSMLFVPSIRPDRFLKALDSGVDGVIIDLEDAVGPEDKVAARDAIRTAWTAFTADQKKRIALRSNAPGSGFYSGDLILAQELDVACLIIPKSESLDQINGAALILPNTAIIPMIETALGIDQLKVIANANQVLRIAFGNIDLQADLRMVCDAQESELQMARYQIVLASRLAQIAPPLDGITPSIDDLARLEQDAQRAKRIGFGGKLAIHPQQIASIQAAFMPTAAEMDWATRVIAADQAAHGGAVKLDGRMIDHPAVLLAHSTLARSGKS